MFKESDCEVAKCSSFTCFPSMCVWDCFAKALKAQKDLQKVNADLKHRTECVYCLYIFWKPAKFKCFSTFSQKRKDILSDRNPGNNSISSKTYLTKQMKCNFWDRALVLCILNVKLDYKLYLIVTTQVKNSNVAWITFNVIARNRYIYFLIKYKERTACTVFYHWLCPPL